MCSFVKKTNDNCELYKTMYVIFSSLVVPQFFLEIKNVSFQFDPIYINQFDFGSAEYVLIRFHHSYMACRTFDQQLTFDPNFFYFSTFNFNYFSKLRYC